MTGDGFNVDAERQRIADLIASGRYSNVVLVEKATPDGNAQHGENTAEEMDGV